MNYIITYDIQKNKARKKVSDLLEQFGIRVQKSVFICEINKIQLDRIKTEVEKLIKKKTDSVIFFYNCNSCKEKRIMLGTPFFELQSTILEV